MREAMFYEKLPDGSVKCCLCYRECLIPAGKSGFCRVRKNVDGRLYAMTYARPCSVEVDPIEKKPFYHFMPGELALSIATVGCNFSCLHCQNWEISQASPGDVPEHELLPEKIVELAQDYKARIIAYTYTEPTVFYEYAYDTGVLARENGLKNVFVTNGYAKPEAVEKSREFLDAVRVDLKGDEQHYQKVCGGAHLENVLNTIKEYYKTGMHLEIITLTIEGYNDKEDWVRQMAGFLKDLDPGIPWHFTRFFPAWKMLDVTVTSFEVLKKMREWAVDEGMQYVYIGNVENEYDNTYCHNCGELLIKRYGFSVVENNIKDGRCPACGARIPGVWE